MRRFVIDLLIRLYPRGFRRTYGREMAQFFELQRQEDRYRSDFGGCRFWAELTLDVLRDAGLQRLRAVASLLDRRSAEIEPVTAAPRPTHPTNRGHVMEPVFQDLRYALRSLRMNLAWTSMAIVTLALGIGATAAMFSVVHNVLLRPLPFDEPDKLYAVSGTNRESSQIYSSVSFPSYEIYRENQQGLESLEAYGRLSMTFNFEERAESLHGALVTAGLFRALGVSPARGRGFQPEEDHPGSNAVVILSHRLWQQRFGGDPEIVGQRFSLEEEPYTIVGVMPGDFAFPDTHAEFWLPMRIAPRTESTFYLRMLGRLRDGVTESELAARFEAMELEMPTGSPGETHTTALEARSLHESIVGQVKPRLLIFLTAVAAVLAIACINVVNLLLGRIVGRERELALRAALGAGRLRLVRQLVCESLLLSAAAGAVGAGLAWVLVRALKIFGSRSLPRLEEVGVDTTAWIFTFALACLVGLVVGLVPALRASRPDLNSSLGEGGRGNAGGARHTRLRHGLIVSQIAVTLVLLVSALVLLRTFVEILEAESGFDAENVLMVETELPGARYEDPERRRTFFEAVLERLAAFPGVRSAAVASSHPFTYRSNRLVTVDGYLPAAGERLVVRSFAVGPGYFSTMGAELRAGRVFDTSDGDLSMIVNETFARRYFADGNPIGRYVRVGQQEMTREVVGVIADVRQFNLGSEPDAVIYLPYSPTVWPYDMTLLIRTEAAPLGLAATVRGVIAEVDRGVPIHRLQTVEDYLWSSLEAPRLQAMLLGAFGLAALLLSMIGLYAVMAYWVSNRTPELGIRMAIGADRGRILRHVISRGLGLTFLGLAIGSLAAVPAARWLAASMPQLAGVDARIYILALAGLAAAAFLATYLPAKRASKLDPVTALHRE